jgi:two-component sensor histidine kinase
MSFLAGDGEMATRIRMFDWADHPLGAPHDWPQSLRSALGVCLHSAFPTAIYWGPELRLLYNDPWSAIPGPRHPACLGEPAKAVWSDIWNVIAPQFARVIETGEGLFVDDQLLPMRRYGYEEETYWSYSFTPIRGDDGAIEGIFNSGQETTAKVLKQRQTAFLLRFADALRDCGEARTLIDEGCRLLGEHLGAIRVGLREREPAGEAFSVTAEWTADGIDTAGPRVPMTTIPSIARCLDEGRVARIERLDDLDVREASALRTVGAASVLAAPWRNSGELGAVLFAHRAQAQPWTDEEVATVEQVLARLIQAIDQERARERDQTVALEIDHRARNVLGVSQSLVRMTDADDVEGFRRSLMGRMQALGSTLRILSASQANEIDLQVLLETELAPFRSKDETRVSFVGAAVAIPPMKAQPISMILHELVTNAVKYGALSGPDGHLAITWSVRDDGVLEIDWRETHVGSASQPHEDRSGFGTKLLKIMIEHTLRGRFDRQFGDGWFRCRIEAPLAAVR